MLRCVLCISIDNIGAQDEMAAFEKADSKPEVDRRVLLRMSDNQNVSARMRARFSFAHMAACVSQSKIRNAPRVVMYDLSGALNSARLPSAAADLPSVSSAGALGSLHTAGSAGPDAEPDADLALWSERLFLPPLANPVLTRLLPVQGRSR